jgi:thymidylate kinase
MTKELKLNLSQLAHRISAHEEKQIIILAGADRVGKTTFANKLFDKLSKDQAIDFNHFGAPNKERQRKYGHNYQYTSYVKNHNWDKARIVIWDRSWICGLVYDVCRRSKLPAMNEAFELEDYLIKLNIQVLVLTFKVPWELVIDGHKQELAAGISPVKTLKQAKDEHYLYQATVSSYARLSYFPFATIERDDDDYQITNGVRVCYPIQ